MAAVHRRCGTTSAQIVAMVLTVGVGAPSSSYAQERESLRTSERGEIRTPIRESIASLWISPEPEAAAVPLRLQAGSAPRRGRSFPIKVGAAIGCASGATVGYFVS